MRALSIVDTFTRLERLISLLPCFPKEKSKVLLKINSWHLKMFPARNVFKYHHIERQFSCPCIYPICIWENPGQAKQWTLMLRRVLITWSQIWRIGSQGWKEGRESLGNINSKPFLLGIRRLEGQGSESGLSGLAS